MLSTNITTWVVLASDTLAKIYEHPRGHRSFKLITELKHDAGRAKVHDLVTDKPGHYKAGGAARGAFVQDHDPKDNENTHFALQLAHYLEDGRVKNQFDEIVIIALPHFYGLLEKHLPKELQKTITRHIMHDYLQAPEKELLEKVFPENEI